MMKYKSLKLWQGKISVRSFIVEFAKKTGQSIEVEYNKQKMIVNSKTPYTCDQMPHLAQRSDMYIKKGDTYHLYDFEWKPIIKIDEWTGDGRLKMLDAWKKLQMGVQKKLI